MGESQIGGRWHAERLELLRRSWREDACDHVASERSLDQAGPALWFGSHQTPGSRRRPVVRSDARDLCNRCIADDDALAEGASVKTRMNVEVLGLPPPVRQFVRRSVLSAAA